MTARPVAQRPVEWGILCDRAMQPDRLPRLLALMGFSRRAAVHERWEFAVRWPPHQPDLRVFNPTWPRRVPKGASDSDRAIAAAWNRRGLEDWARHAIAFRQSPVFVMVRDAPHREVWLDAGSTHGEWRDARGGAEGEDLVGLGAYMWDCSRMRAAWRISRGCGHQELPRAGDRAAAGGRFGAGGKQASASRPVIGRGRAVDDACADGGELRNPAA